MMPAAKSIGAQRLYKAITKNDVPIVTLFLSSEKKGLFSYQKAFNAWVEGGKIPEMLEALMQYQPFQKWDEPYHRINKETFANEEFGFGYRVLRLLTKAATGNPGSDQVLWMQAVTKIVVSCNKGDKVLNESQFARYLGEALDQNNEWPWCIGAISRGIGIELATRGYSEKAKQGEVIEWFHSVHGEVVEDDIKPYEANFCRFMDVDKYKQLVMLIPQDDVREKVLAYKSYGFDNHIRGVLQGYKNYKKLIAIAPWLEEK
jgi:hypothetical protein